MSSSFSRLSSFFAIALCCLAAVATVSAQAGPPAPSAGSVVDTRVFILCSTDCYNAPQHLYAVVFAVNITQDTTVESLQQQVQSMCQNSTTNYLALALNPALPTGLTGAVINPEYSMQILQPSDFLCLASQSSVDAFRSVEKKKKHHAHTRVASAGPTVPVAGSFPVRVSVNCSSSLNILVPLYIQGTSFTAEDIAVSLSAGCGQPNQNAELAVQIPGMAGLVGLPYNGLASNLIQDNDVLLLLPSP